MKKLLAVLLSVVLVFSLASVGFAAGSNTTLQFDENGKFKILVFADVQTDYPMQDEMIFFMEEAIRASDPDLIVFTGDNINNDDKRTYAQMLAPCIEAGVPYTMVLGNHDQENSGGMTREEIVAEYQKYEGFIGYDADPSIHGAGTHNLPILSSDGSKTAFNLWMFDTGDYVRASNGEWLGYDWVREDQIEWYKSVRDEMTAANGGELVPSLVFQHIIPQEPCEKIFLPTDIKLGEATINFQDGTIYTFIPDMTQYEGYLFERCCPSYGNDGQWDAMVEGGDVLGVVCGHDHVNGFIANCDGIDLIMAPGCTYDSYYNNMIQGARVIELDESNPWEYSTHLLTANELAQNPESNLGHHGGDRTEFSYNFFYYFEKIFGVFINILRNMLSGGIAM